MFKRLPLLILLAGMAIAEQADAQDEGPQSKEANEAFEKGKSLFKEGDYTSAAESFRRAYTLRPSWKLFYNIGQCTAADKRYGEALEAFERYLAEGGDEISKDRQQSVIDEITRLRNLVGYFEISAEDGASIFVDGVERGVTPELKRLPVTATVEHEVYAVLNGEKGRVQSYKVTGGDTVTITLVENDVEGPTPAEVETEPDSVASEAAESTEDKPEPEKRPAGWTLGWIALGTGVAALGGGAITGGLALSKNGELEDKCEENGCYSSEYSLMDSRNALATTSTVLFISGGVIAATGATLLIVFRKSNNDMDVAVAPGPGSFLLTGRF